LIVGIPDPRQEIVDSFFQGVFEGRSKASSLRAARSQDARIRTETEETVGQHQKVPVAAGTFVQLYLVVSKAEILLRVLGNVSMRQRFEYERIR